MKVMGGMPRVVSVWDDSPCPLVGMVLEFRRDEFSDEAVTALVEWSDDSATRTVEYVDELVPRR